LLLPAQRKIGLKVVVSEVLNVDIDSSMFYD